MDNKKQLAEIATNALADIIEPVYNDLAHPAAEETGKFAGRIPRFLNALCSDFDIWILKREYNIKMVTLELEKQLKNVPPEKIVEPEPYVAVPVLPAILYSYDSNELRSMYAHLLAKAMHVDYKNEVHPSFVEIIKQLSPLDCLVFKEIVSNTIATFGVFDASIDKISEFEEHLIYYAASLNSCDEVKQIRISLDNLSRLKLIDKTDNLNGSFEGDYVGFFSSEFVDFSSELNGDSNDEFYYDQRVFRLTDFGRSFSEICVLDI